MASKAGPSQNPFASPNITTPREDHSPPNPSPQGSSGTSGRKRIPHACDRCRLMRTKCSGGQRCNRCKRDDAVCVYGDNKRERNRKDFVDSVNRVKELEDDNRVLVAAVRQATVSGDARSLANSEIFDVLAKYSGEEQGESSQGSRGQSREIKSPIQQTEPEFRSTGGEAKVSSSIGSPGHQGELRRVINMTHNTGAAGFIGKMSEMSWMQRCREYLIDQSDTNMTDIHQPEFDQHAAAVLDLTYFTHDQDLLAVDEDVVDLDPPKFDDVAITSEAFFLATQGALHFLPREVFWESISTLYQPETQMTWPLRRRLAIANLVWAIGSKWLYLTKLEGSESFSLHLIYYARARALGLDHRVALDNPDVEMVQGLGLLAFYLLINGSITRAWNTIGNAIQHATTLGLHLRVTDPSIGEIDKSRRARTWFSLYKLQTLMAEVTGRPQLLRYSHVTIPLEALEQDISTRDAREVPPSVLELSFNAKNTWLQFLNIRSADDRSVSGIVDTRLGSLDMDESTSQQAFLYYIRLCQLSEEIAGALYTGNQDSPWSQTQAKIAELQRDLDAWNGTLPDYLRIDETEDVRDQPRANIQLAMYSCSVSMILHRPCLCDIEIDEESQHSKNFNQSSAQTCINSAISMIRLVPDPSATFEMYRLLPWWTLLHYLCQAASVLLIEICLDVQHLPGQRVRVASALDKAMSHLANLTLESKSAYRAWRIFQDSIQRLDARSGRQGTLTHGVLADSPHNWTDLDELTLVASLSQIDA